MKLPAATTLVGPLVLALLVFLVICWTLPDPPVQHPEAAIVPPPTHIEWEEYPVEGMFLCKPTLDSLGQAQCLEMPAGAILIVPWVTEGSAPDEAPDSLRVRS
jgi:hypothetical protein